MRLTNSVCQIETMSHQNLILFFLRHRFLPIVLLSFLFITNFSTPAQDANFTSSRPRVKADRWVEVDLYWFDRNDIPGSSERFWQRYAPLFEGAEGWRGVILNVGWTVDYVMDWRGNLDQEISFPVGFVQQSWVEMGGQGASQFLMG